MPTYKELHRILKNMLFVADVYDLIIPADEQKKALVDVTSILMMYACGKYGMDPLDY
jgi:transcription antitermination factor NusA-like protein